MKRISHIKFPSIHFDNSFKVLGLVALTVTLTIAAIFLSSNFVQQLHANEIRVAASDYANTLSKKIKAMEENLLTAASVPNVFDQTTFRPVATRALAEYPSVFRIELRSSSGKLIASLERAGLEEKLKSGNRTQLPPAVFLNFLRTQDQQRFFWSKSPLPSSYSALELIIPSKGPRDLIWLVRVDPQMWLAPKSGIDLQKNVSVSFSDQPQVGASSMTTSVSLNLMGLESHLVFSPTDNDFISIDWLTGLLAVLGVLLIVLLLSYVFESRRSRIAQDTITKQETALAKQSQLSILGEISTALAHELNQPLATIANYVAACEMRVKSQNYDDALLLDSLEKTRQQAMRAGEVVQSIRNYLRKRPNTAASVDMRETLEQLRPIIELSCKEFSCKLSLKLEHGVMSRIDPALLEQVLLNLSRNGIDAMENTPPDKRELIIRAYIYQARNTTQWARVDVSDQGHGISEEAAKQLFESFFTTKTEGMGIGLSLCRSVAESYGGRIRWINNPHGGATFSLFLPLRMPS